MKKRGKKSWTMWAVIGDNFPKEFWDDFEVAKACYTVRTLRGEVCEIKKVKITEC
jgi:hypothetical protein